MIFLAITDIESLLDVCFALTEDESLEKHNNAKQGNGSRFSMSYSCKNKF
jgi:hypothetical protein